MSPRPSYADATATLRQTALVEAPRLTRVDHFEARLTIARITGMIIAGLIREGWPEAEALTLGRIFEIAANDELRDAAPFMTPARSY